MNDDTIGVDEQRVITDDPVLLSNTPQEREKREAAQHFQAANQDKTIKVRVSSTFQTYYEGFVYSLTAESATGPFDILPGHHNFISLLIACELIIRPVDNEEMKIRISGGVIHIKADAVIVFLDV